MPQPNIKVYLLVSGLLIVLFLVVTFVPFGKKTINKVNKYSPIPTTVEVNPPPYLEPTIGAPYIEPVEFTGVKDIELPPEVLERSTQKRDLRITTPFDTGLFRIDFDYSEDKFLVSINEPRKDNLKQFEDWKRNNYPAIPINQFIFN
ncbi:MAG: hypothetical protein UR63_C0019G0003 [Candidatus Roizmanbacteria bacterium GW2011_GWC2_35_12]|uniref:Uncharacterized protein n=1 Tax=Candidatus Roizmanbacteria bacterium GW2011_GWC2_35_12 TaxID=1618485 RepID=A0A0G0BCS1_9BACT|nr:MAG: hypothetical protein UR63_C0019G0003 [Candidatus Roizmanbacteria bacterium GW2011_GWC2_35_12]